MRTYTITEYDMEDYDNFRDNITIEETITLLRHINRGYIGDYCFTGDEYDFDRFKLHIALDNAIQALIEIQDKQKEETEKQRNGKQGRK